MDERNFINALSRAQQLIHDPNFNRQVESRAAGEAALHRKGGGGAAQGSAEIANLDAMVFGLGTSTPPPQRAPQRKMVAEQQQYYEDYEPIQQIQPQPRDLSNSRLPKEIIESFTTNPTPEGYFESSVGKMEGLDSLMGGGSPRTQVNEAVRQPQRQAAPQPQYYPQGGSIDYEYVKYLVKEAVKEAMGTLNESVGLNGMHGMRIGEGNVIQFLDKKGNVYEGKLVLKKKAKN